MAQQQLLVQQQMLQLQQKQLAGLAAGGAATTGGVAAAAATAAAASPATSVDSSALERRVYVGSLPYDLTEEQIKLPFASFGTIVKIDMPREPGPWTCLPPFASFTRCSSSVCVCVFCSKWS